MYVRALSLTDFRSYGALDVEFTAGVNVLIGPNGQGKTNLLEALGYVATQGSHRVANDAPLVRSGARYAVVRMTVVRDGRETLVELEVNPGRANRARVNRASVPRPREVLGLLRTVLFAPEDLALVKGEPDGRRRFLDEVLIARYPRYAAVRADYERVLKQRNTLLRSAAPSRRAGACGDYRTLDVWDEHLVRHGAELLAGRLVLLDALRPLVADAYDRVAPEGGALELSYRQRFGSEAAEVGPDEQPVLATRLLAALASVRGAELERGQSLVGPHRDDLVLTLRGLPAKGYASHGESWSAALALRLGSYELLRADGGEPVLLLDDVFAELDTARRAKLAELVEGAEQVLVTAAVAADVPLVGARLDVRDGTVSRVF